MRSNLFGEHLAESGQAAGTFSMQNNRMLRVRLQDSNVYALKGAMVAYQGEMSFDYKFSGAGKALKRMLTGEGLPLMEVKGSGDLYIAHNSAEIHLVYLEGDALIVNGISVIAFEPRLTWDIKMVKGISKFAGGSGWFNVVLSGTGWVALTAFGAPVVLQTSAAPAYVDFDAAVAWSANLKTELHTSFNLKSLFGWGSGEAAEMGFSGDGIVVVQASEGPPGLEPKPETPRPKNT
jgi:uncharacterized protein (AIM24 family)